MKKITEPEKLKTHIKTNLEKLNQITNDMTNKIKTEYAKQKKLFKIIFSARTHLTPACAGRPALSLSRRGEMKNIFVSILVLMMILGQLVSPGVAEAATYNFTQSSWAGGATANTGTHATNQTGWTEYIGATGVTAGADVKLPLTSYAFTDGGTPSTAPVSPIATGGGLANGAKINTAVINRESIKLSTTNVATPSVAGGGESGYALKSDGTVSAWGNNGNGQLGDGTTTQRNTPVQVSGLTGMTSIAAGATSGYALKSDGTVWAWGNNYYAQLGDNTGTNRSTPVQVSGLTGVTSIAAAVYSGYALKSDGTVWAWGHNSSGQLGDNTTTDRGIPVQVSGLTGVTVIASVGYSGYALKSDGTVWAWGNNGNGQLGDGTTTQRNTPVQVSGLTGVTSIAAGATSGYALKSDGTIFAWGYNAQGQLGDNTQTQRLTPVQVSGLTGVTSIAAGYYSGYALKSDGTIWSWGRNTQGQLGDNTGTDRSTPVQVSGLTGVTFIAGGGNGSAYALKSDGTVWSWGSNSSGQLGDNTLTQRNTPVQVYSATPSGVFLADTTANYHIAGGSSGYALKSDGTVWAWGRNDFGQLGDNTVIQRNTPVQVSGLTGMTSIAGGNLSGYALKSDGTVWAWGRNDFGQLGDNTQTNRLTPVQVSGLTGITAIAAGASSGYALKSDGTVWSWGGNFNGQLGDNTVTQRNIPVQVSGLASVTSIAGGQYSGYALKSDGTISAWGSNSSGQLGDNTVTQRNIPVQVSGLAGATSVAGGQYSGYALKSDGTISAWGSNAQGQLGDNTWINRLTPVQVSGLTGVTVIASVGYSGYALKSDGTVWAWGYNGWAQLGDNTTIDRRIPVQVSGLTGMTSVAGGLYSGYALKSDGTISAWGYNNFGQLGDNTTTNRLTPVQVKYFLSTDRLNAGTSLYNTSGTFTSAVLDTGAQAGFTTFGFGTTIPTGTTLTVDVRAGNTATPDGSWSSWTTNVISGGSISSLAGNRYIQYRANLSTSDPLVTPTLTSVTINYTQYTTSGTLTSSKYDAGDATNLISKISWSATGTSGTETVKFQVRSSPDGITWSNWCGASTACLGTDYFQTADNGVAFATGHPLKTGANDRYLQYQAFFTSGGAVTPVLVSVTPQYVVNAPPEFNVDYPTLGAGGATASQNSSTVSPDFGKVNISYSAKDIDTATGSSTPNQIAPSFEYSINGGSTWAAIPSLNLASGDVSPKTILAGSYTTYNATWDAKTTIPNTEVVNAKVRVTVNDGEAANNTALAPTANFALDTKAPTGSAVTIDAGLAGVINSATVTIPMPTDQSAVQYLITDTGTQTNGINSGWTAITGNTTIPWTFDSDIEIKSLKYQFKDALGNITGEETISTLAPVGATSFIVQDTSNVAGSPPSYDMYLGWAAANANGFSSYKLEYATSSDNSTYSSYATISHPSMSDVTANYYVHRNLDTNKVYRYRLAVIGTNGTTSVRSGSYITAKPDGVQNFGEGGGGSVATASKVENVEVVQNGDKTVTATYKLTDTSFAKKLNPSYEAYLFYNIGITLPANPLVGSSLTISDASKLKSSGYIMINNEVMSYSGKTGNTLTGIVRGTWPNLNTSNRTTRQNIVMFAGTVVWVNANGTTPVAITNSTITSGQTGSIAWDTNTETALVGSSYPNVGVRVVVHDNQDAGSGPLSTQNDYSEKGILNTLDLTMPTISFGGISGTGDETVSPATVTLNLSHSYPLDTTVNYTLSGTATAGADYTLSNGTITIIAGQTTGSITMPIINDGVSEFDETMIVTLSSPTNATLGVNTVYTYTIIDNLLPTVQFNSTTGQGLESTASANIPVSLSASYSADVIVSYSVTGGTATGGGVDFTLADGTVTIPLGETSANIPLLISSDNASEPDEMILVTMSSPVNATLGIYTIFTYTILDDEIAVTETSQSAIKATSALITWTTGDFTDSLVQYGTTAPGGEGAYNLSKTNAEKVLNHSIYLGGLTPSTTYYYKTTSTNLAGEATSTESSFATTAGSVISLVSSSGVTDTSATITWTTDIPASSYVSFSTDSAFGNPTRFGTADLVTEHSVTLTSLDSNATYYYFVDGTDADTNVSEDKNNGDYFTFNTAADETAPVISNIGTPVIAYTQAAIVWETNEPADSQIMYGISPGSYNNQTTLVLTLLRNHLVALSDLEKDTTYYYVIVSADTNGNSTTSSEQSFKTTAKEQVVVGGGGSMGVAQELYDALLAQNEIYKGKFGTDTTSPEISNIEVKDVTAFGATLSFETNKDTMAFINYGKDTNYGSLAADDNFSQTHSVKITGLTLGTEYNFKIKVLDRLNNTAYSDNQTLKTLFLAENLEELKKIDNVELFMNELDNLLSSILPSLATPFVGEVSVKDISFDSATVSWNTSSKTYGSVAYSTRDEFAKNSTDYTTEVSASKDKVTKHEITLTGLKPSTSYHFVARGFVFPGVVGSSYDKTFATKAENAKAGAVKATNNSFTLSWQTADQTTSFVEYKNLKTGKVAEMGNKELTKNHIVEVNNLSGATTFEAKYYGFTTDGVKIEGSPMRVTTLVDNRAPVIDDVSISSAFIPYRPNQLQTLISWKTDEPANSMIEYEEGPGSSDTLANKSEKDAELTKDHIVILPGFKPGTIYRVRITSIDGAGNKAVVPTRTIITPVASDTVFEIIINNFEDVFGFLKNVR